MAEHTAKQKATVKRCDCNEVAHVHYVHTSSNGYHSYYKTWHRAMLRATKGY